jgi:RNA polymerase sigma-70 factor, ECF subfamily
MLSEAERQHLFAQIVEASRRQILAISRNFAHPEDRSDLCQDILLQIWRNLDSFEGRAAPSTWVYRVALNTALSYRRKNGRRVEVPARPLDESGSEPAIPAGSGNEILILEEFLRSLGEIDRAVFLLYLEDLSYRQMSEVTGLSENHVGVRISRLKKAFIERFCGG